MTTTFLPAPNNIRKNRLDSEKLKSSIPAPLLPVPGQKDACYKMSLILVEWIDASLGRERVHFRNRAGELLTTLDQVVVAILSNDLLEPAA